MIQAGAALFQIDHLRQMSDEDLGRLLRWAIAEGELAGSVQPRLARLYGILAADLRFELWLRAQSVRKNAAPPEAQRPAVPRGIQVH